MERRCKHEQTLCLPTDDRAARLRQAGEDLREIMRSLALEWVDRQVVSLLGDDYPWKALVDFVRARHRPGTTIRAGLVFDWEHGIAREFCRKVRQERMSMPSRTSVMIVCPQCSATGLIGGKIRTTPPELRAIERPSFCGCNDGRVARNCMELRPIHRGQASSAPSPTLRLRKSCQR
jgi:hypothetical protein